MEDAIAFAKEKKFSVILGMDSNSHSELYGYSTNKRGEDLEDFIFSNNLRVENTGKIPTFESHIGKTIIDVTLTYDLPLLMLGWKVDREYNGSDHNTITASLGREKNR